MNAAELVELHRLFAVVADEQLCPLTVLDRMLAHTEAVKKRLLVARAAVVARMDTDDRLRHMAEEMAVAEGKW